MKIHAHFLCFNEADMIPLVLPYYFQFCEKITVWDNHSEDNSRELAKSFGAEVRFFGKPGVLDDYEYLKVKNNAGNLSRGADWVIVCDMDEVLVPKAGTVAETLAGLKAFNVVATEGYNMISDTMPENLLDVGFGCRASQYDKQICFRPGRVRPNYSLGAHSVRWSGRVAISPPVFWLAHYKFIGSFDRIYSKYLKNAARMSAKNRAQGLGVHYLQTSEQVLAGINHEKQNGIQLW